MAELVSDEQLVLKMYREENARLRKKVENQAQNIRGLLKR